MNAFYVTPYWGNSLTASWNKTIADIRGTYPIAFVQRELFANPEPLFIPEYVRLQQPLAITEPVAEKIDPNKVGTIPSIPKLEELKTELTATAKDTIMMVLLGLLAIVLLGVGVYGLVK